MNVLLINFLIAIKNAYILKKEVIEFFFNKKFILLSKVLYKNGLIQDFWLEKQKFNKLKIIVTLKYFQNFSNFFKFNHSTNWTVTSTTPADRSAIWENSSRGKSTTRPGINGPVETMVDSTVAPVARLVTRMRLPSGKELHAAPVQSYQLAIPCTMSSGNGFSNTAIMACFFLSLPR